MTLAAQQNLELPGDSPLGMSVRVFLDWLSEVRRLTLFQLSVFPDKSKKKANGPWHSSLSLCFLTVDAHDQLPYVPATVPSSP